MPEWLSLVLTVVNLRFRIQISIPADLRLCSVTRPHSPAARLGLDVAGGGLKGLFPAPHAGDIGSGVVEALEMGTVCGQSRV